MDEDLTEMMFPKLYWVPNVLDRKGIKKGIPVFREHTFKGLGYSEVEDWEDGIVWQIMRAERADKPWYVNQ